MNPDPPTPPKDWNIAPLCQLFGVATATPTDYGWEITCSCYDGAPDAGPHPHASGRTYADTLEMWRVELDDQRDDDLYPDAKRLAGRIAQAALKLELSTSLDLTTEAIADAAELMKCPTSVPQIRKARSSLVRAQTYATTAMTLLDVIALNRKGK